MIIKRSCDPDIDFVLHAGDIFDRSSPHKDVLDYAYQLFVTIADRKPLVIIPGNHDRSRFDPRLLQSLSQCYVLNKLSEIYLKISGIDIRILGFPHTGKEVNKRLLEIKKPLIPQREFHGYSILLMHELMESAVNGIHNFVFQKWHKGAIALKNVPRDFDYIALGHVHRFQQIFVPDLPQTKIVYSGSIERTSSIEREEKKGYVETTVNVSENRLKKNTKISFIELPTRPLLLFESGVCNPSSMQQLFTRIQEIVHRCDQKPIVKVRLTENADLDWLSATRKLLHSLQLDGALKSFNVIPVGWNSQYGTH